MGRSRLAALMIAVLIIGLGVGRTATASHQPTHTAFSAGAGSKGLVVKTETSQLSIGLVFDSWQTVESRGFQIPAGESQLVSIDFFSVILNCAGGGDCLVRARVGRTLAASMAAQPGSEVTFADVGDEVAANAMSWALCVKNATSSPLDVSVWLEATKSSGTVTDYIFGERTLKIARSAPCSPTIDI